MFYVLMPQSCYLAFLLGQGLAFFVKTGWQPVV